MIRSLLLALLSILLLTACSSDPKSLFNEQVLNSHTPLAQTPQEAIQNAHVESLPTNPGWRPPQWEITPQEPRIMLDGTPSNYRVFSIHLEQNEPFQINVDSWCVNACLGFSKYALTPYLMLLDNQGTVVASGFGVVKGAVGSINQEIAGKVASSGLYYLIVAADNRNPGRTVVVDNVIIIGAANRSITPLRIGMGSYPFGSISPYLSTAAE
ncbi:MULTISPECIES: hypothetical protein [unclassified Pseudomonas]|uniref:hypothetical protein n=1 Tax=unclassified Pseudomonas TaxID=196821 RepID=UPI0009EAA428|nr:MULTISPECIES: hypothetical protein [unclassified Pseudomonas]